MNETMKSDEGLAKSVKLGVGALVVLAVVAVAAGAVWYFQRNVLPTCGSPEATALVTQIVSENLAKDLTSQQTTTLTKSVKLSLDMVEKGELSSGGNIRKCSAQLVATLDPDMKRFASETHGEGFQGIRKESADRFSISLDYELKALDSESSPWAASLPGSLQLGAFHGAMTLLATTYEPQQAVMQRTDPAIDTATTASGVGTDFTLKRALVFSELGQEDRILLAGTSAADLIKEEASVAREDLDGDGVDELIVQSASTDFCGSGGCLTIVLGKTAEGYRSLLQQNLSQNLGVTNERVGDYRVLCAVDGKTIMVGDMEGSPLYRKQLVYRLK